MYGGQQEHGIRPGTIPVALVAGLGKACDLAESEYIDYLKKCKEIKDCILNRLDESGVDYKINGDQRYCISSTLNLAFAGVSSEALMLATKQHCGVSNGSACNSNSYDHSHVLIAMGLPIEQIESSIRVSWGSTVEYQEVDSEFRELLNIVKSMV